MNIISSILNNISISRGTIIVNGKTIKFDDIPDKEINIICEGNAGDINVDVCNSIKISGTAKSVELTNGNIHCGDVDGDVKTVNGDVEAKIIKGRTSTVNGDINT